VNPDAPKGGEYSTWAFGTFDSLTPYVLKGNAAAGATVFYDSLLTGNLEEPRRQLRPAGPYHRIPRKPRMGDLSHAPEARFRDGSPVLASDVVFSFNILLEKGLPSFKTAYQDIISVEALEDHKVKFTFNPEAPCANC
jgi:microcin C transport system substrate-binding protein